MARRWAPPGHRIARRAGDAYALPAPPAAAVVKVEEGAAGRWRARHLIAWFEHGRGAAEIGWGGPDDFAKCVALASQHMTESQAKGFCNLRHHGATGMWPAQHAAAVRRAEGRKGANPTPSVHKLLTVDGGVGSVVGSGPPRREPPTMTGDRIDYPAITHALLGGCHTIVDLGRHFGVPHDHADLRAKVLDMLDTGFLSVAKTAGAGAGDALPIAVTDTNPYRGAGRHRADVGPVPLVDPAQLPPLAIDPPATAVAPVSPAPARRRDVIGKRFDPAEPRDDHGRWSIMGAIEDAIAHGSAPDRKPVELRDRLKLAGKINLGEGERLAGSAKVTGEDGRVMVAAVDGPTGRQIRIGVGSAWFGGRDDEAGPWRAAPSDVAEVNAQRAALRAEEARLGQRADDIDAVALAAMKAEADPIHARLHTLSSMTIGEPTEHGYAYVPLPPELEAEHRTLKDQIHALHADGLGSGIPSDRARRRYLTAEQRAEQADLWRRIEALDAPHEDVYPSGYTANLTTAQARQLHDEVRAALDTVVAEHARRDKIWDEIGADNLPELEARQEELRRASWARPDRKWTPEEDAAWDALDGQITQLRQRIQEQADADEALEFEGTVPGQWADVHYYVILDDGSVGPEVYLGAVPHGMAWDDLNSQQDKAELTPAETESLLTHLDTMSRDPGHPPAIV